MKLQLNIQPLNSWINIKNEPLLISGPCSAETEDQLLSTAHLLAATGKVSILRAGIGNHALVRANLKVLEV